MRKIVLYISFFCFTGISATNSFPVMAGGCSTQVNKITEIKCAEDDAECQTVKKEKFGINNSVRS